MAESIQHFALKTIGLSRCKGRKPCTLLEAARHNLREIQAELGARGHINPQRTAINATITGPATAGEVQALAESLLAQVDTSRLKRDHVQAIEAVFSLPIGSDINPDGYFTHCLKWAGDALRMPVLLATAHYDEAAPHMHVLMLPVRDGKHIGGAIMLRESLKRVRESFFTKVAGPAGLKRDGAKVRGMVKQWAIAGVVARCEGLALPAAMGPLWPVWVAAIERDPTPAMLALGIDVNTLRPTSEQHMQAPIGLDARAIGLQNEGQKNQALSCVGLPTQTTHASAKKPAPASVSTLTSTTPPIDTLSALWAAVGCRSNWTTPSKAERMRRARDAQQRAIKRYRSKPALVLRAGAALASDDGLTRERDEYAHDLSAWTD
jgi:hypothetical protein